MDNTHKNETTNQTESIASITNALMEDLFNPSISTLDLCNLHRLTLSELAATLESETFKSARAAFERINNARSSIIESESKTLAKARLADQLKDKPETPSHAETQRKAATQLLRPTSSKVQSQPIQSSPLVHPQGSATLSPMNNTHKSIAISTLAALTTLSTAGSTGTTTEDYSTGIGQTSSFTAFAGTPAETQITSPGSIWIGDVQGLTTQLDNPFYNDQTDFPAGTPVLAFGPDSLHPIVSINFPVSITHTEFIIYDIETLGAVQVLGFDDQGAEIYNSGTINADSQFASLFDTNFDPPIRELLIEAVNQDGLMLSPIEITYAPLSCNPADLTNDGVLNFFDVSAFLSAFTSNDPIADFTNDGTFNFFDVSAFLSAFTAGCP